MVALDKLAQCAQWQKRLIAAVYDFFVVLFALWFALSVRFGEPVSFDQIQWMILILLGAVIAVPCFFLARLYHLVVRYAGYQLLWIVVKGVTFAVLIWGTAVLMMRLPGFPRSVIFIYWFVAFVLVFSGRLVAQNLLRKSLGIPIAIYGAGSEGVQLAMALQHDANYRPVLFLDDNSELWGSHMMNLRVYPVDQFDGLCRQRGVKEIFVTIHFPTRSDRNRLLKRLQNYPVRVRVLPLFSQLARGKINIHDFERIDADDLLGREVVSPNATLLRKNITGKSVMITGAGGSIGSELCRQISNLAPSRIILLEHSEHVLYEIERSLKNKLPTDRQPQIVPVLGQVQDRKLVEEVLREQEVATIYHAAAYKHVALVEENTIQGLRNNAFGTLALAQSAIECDVEIFVLISTDKAVRPSGVMGVSKRLAEMILQALAAERQTPCFSMVRFGNVLDSSGSVIPLFRQQIAEGGPVTVTHQDMTRYFMTLKEAVGLTIQAGSMSQGGEVFVLDMGDPIKIDELARMMVSFSGLRVKDDKNPDGDIAIEYIGARRGEKITEELLTGDNAFATEHPKILCAKENFLPWEKLLRLLQEIESAIKVRDTETTLELLNQVLAAQKPN